MTFKVKILGSNSAIPAYNRNHTSQAITIGNDHILVDCGEGTQLQCSKYKVRLSKINCIFISHLHGDHYLGLMGVISSMHLLGRTKPLHIFGPKGLREIITVQLKYSDTSLRFPVHFTEVDTTVSEVIYETNQYEVVSIPLNHRIDCSGFLFREKKKKRRILKDKLPADILPSEIGKLKTGLDIETKSGKTVHYLDVTAEPLRSRSYAFCSDTVYLEPIIPIIKGIDLLYHESTFLDEHEARAVITYHSTAKQAATLAKKAQVKKLLLGHFSSRYKELDEFVVEASSIFKACALATEGSIFEIEH